MLMMQLRQRLLVKPVPFRWLPASQPGQATDWSDPAKYQGYVPVQILGINDFHGGLSNTGTAQIGDQTYQNTGTAERLAGSLNQAESDFKAANPDGTTIRVEAGDMVGASPANSALLQDESTMHALKAMHIEYGTLGNHEFDEGLSESRSFKKARCQLRP